MHKKNKSGMLAALLVCAAMGLAVAPLASASETCPNADMTLNARDTIAPHSDLSRSISGTTVRVYELPAFSHAEKVLLSEGSGAVEFRVLKAVGSCEQAQGWTAVSANPTEYRPAETDLGTSFYIQVRLASGTSATFDIERDFA